MPRALERFSFARADAPAVRSTTAAWPTTALVGRSLLAAIFLVSGIAKLADPSGTLAYMRGEGIPAAQVLLVVAALVEILGGLSVLTGTFARIGALALLAFMVPTTLIFHDFWSFSGQEQKMQMVQFMKNLSIMGGLLLLLGYGAGRISVDRKIIDRTHPPPAL
jgi:putative oxidoreductase